MESAATNRPAASERVSGVRRNLPTANGNEEIEDIKIKPMKFGLRAQNHASHAMRQSMGNSDAISAARVELAKWKSVTT